MKRLDNEKLIGMLSKEEYGVYLSNDFAIVEVDGIFVVTKNLKLDNDFFANNSIEKIKGFLADLDVHFEESDFNKVKEFLKQLEVYFITKETSDGQEEKIFEGTIRDIFDNQEKLGVSLEAAGAVPFNETDASECKISTTGNDGYKYFIKKKC